MLGGSARCCRGCAGGRLPLGCPCCLPQRPACRPQPAEDQQLFKGDVALEDGRSLAELKVENDEELGVAYRLDGGWRARRQALPAAGTAASLLAWLDTMQGGSWRPLQRGNKRHRLWASPLPARCPAAVPQAASLRRCTLSGLTRA